MQSFADVGSLFSVISGVILKNKKKKNQGLWSNLFMEFISDLVKLLNSHLFVVWWSNV